MLQVKHSHVPAVHPAEVGEPFLLAELPSAPRFPTDGTANLSSPRQHSRDKHTAGQNPHAIESTFPEGSCSSGIHLCPPPKKKKNLLLTLAMLGLTGLPSPLVLENFS